MWSFVPDLTVSHSPSADWWQESEAHARGAAAFFPPLLNLHPAFASNLKSYDPSHLQSSGKKIKKKNQKNSSLLQNVMPNIVDAWRGPAQWHWNLNFNPNIWLICCACRRLGSVLVWRQCHFSVGVSGIMTGRSTSPTGSSAVKTKSMGTMETSDANSSHSQPSGQEMCQQRQRDLQKAQEKVDSSAKKISLLSPPPCPICSWTKR